jgi:elongation of very long chain fatty acids protein 4
MSSSSSAGDGAKKQSLFSFYYEPHSRFLKLHSALLVGTLVYERESLYGVMDHCCISEKLIFLYQWLKSANTYSSLLVVNFVLMLAVILITTTEPTNATVEKKEEVSKASTTVAEKKESKLFPTISSVIFPFSLLIAYIGLVYSMMAGLYSTALTMQQEHPDTFEGHDATKKVWFEGPLYGTIIYLSAVYFGPRIMKNRKPFEITSYIFVYNLYQCLMNLVCVLSVIYILFTNPHFRSEIKIAEGFYLPKLWGNRSQAGIDGFSIALVVWVHYNNKYFELLDTLWMVLRKKNDQISFLHVYHHVLLIWAWWYCCWIGLGGDCYFGATVNSFIHIIMYGYYTGALLKYDLKSIKKNITNCQMTQFACVLCHSIYVCMYRNVPIELPIAQAFVMINMLYLFNEFAKKAYADKKKREASQTNLDSLTSNKSTTVADDAKKK